MFLGDRHLVCSYMQYQSFISLGLAGGAATPYEECQMVRKNICKDVPEVVDVTAEVETCIETPKETCAMEKQPLVKYICEKIKPGTEE